MHLLEKVKPVTSGSINFLTKVNIFDQIAL